MEEKKFEMMNDQELEQVSGGWGDPSLVDALSPERIAECCSGPGSPTNNTLKWCPSCTYREESDHKGAILEGSAFDSVWDYGVHKRICYWCGLAYYFNEAGELKAVSGLG